MATIRKREWATARGEPRSAWIADFKDAEGRRRYRQFDKRKDADRWLLEARQQVERGTFSPDSASITVSEAAALWLERCRANGLEPASIAVYRAHLRHHIEPLIGQLKLSRLTMPMVEAFVDKMLADGRSRLLARKVLGSLVSIIRETQRRGLVAQNVAQGVKVSMPKRHERKVIIPTQAEVRELLQNGKPGREKTLLTLAALTGLRASRIRALTWNNVDFDKREIRVRVRADKSGSLGAPKSASSRRHVPMPPTLVTVLKEWRIASGGRDGLVFEGRSKARPVCHGTLRSMAGRVHRLRHFYASWLIDQGFPPKRVQVLIGNGSISIKSGFDTYGHLFPQDDDQAQFAAAERALL